MVACNPCSAASDAKLFSLIHYFMGAWPVASELKIGGPKWLTLRVSFSNAVGRLRSRCRRAFASRPRTRWSPLNTEGGTGLRRLGPEGDQSSAVRHCSIGVGR